MNNKKITILLPFFLDGGVERAMLNLSKEMISHGIKVDFVLMSVNNGPLKSEIPNKCKIIELGSGNMFFSVIRFIKYIRKEKPDTIISALTPANILAIIGKYISFRKVKVVVEIQVAVEISESTSFFKSKIRPIFYRIFLPLADKIVSVSRGIKEDLLGFGIPSSKIIVIYNPIFSNDIELIAEEKVDHKWFNDDIPIIIGVGRLHKQKNFPLLIESFAKVRKEKNARPVILGEGEERKNLLDLIKEFDIEDCVDLVGFVSNPYSYMKKSKLFVLSSDWEGFGNVLAEALCLGVPVVSTNCKWGPSEILEDGKYGKLVPVGNSDALADSIIYCLDSNSNNLNSEGGKRFRSDFIFKQYMEII